jgi:Mg2+ and Co2+ transporter CorA
LNWRQNTKNYCCSLIRKHAEPLRFESFNIQDELLKSHAEREVAAQRRIHELQESIVAKKSRIKSLKSLLETSSELQREFSNKFGIISQETNLVVDKLNAQRKQSMKSYWLYSILIC